MPLEPVRIRRVTHQMTVKVRCAIVPPDRPTFPKRDLGRIDARTRLPHCLRIGEPSTLAHSPPGRHQF